MDYSLAKRCTKCGDLKPLEAYYSKVRGNGNVRYESWCISCYSSYKKSLKPSVLPEVNKTCTVCGDEKHHSSFSRNGRSKDGLMAHCKLCKKDIDLECNLKRKYGLDTVTFNAMKKEQEYKCLICKKDKSLVVDHCHSSGRVRGLLCHQCNTLIGFAGEDVNIFERAIQYVRRYE